LPVLQDVFSIKSDDGLDMFLNERRQSNVQFILNALKT